MRSYLGLFGSLVEFKKEERNEKVVFFVERRLMEVSATPK
jgi:hypothetical protein